MGTRSFPAELAIGTAIDFHHMIGAERKENRLRYLKDYWMEGLRVSPNVYITTEDLDKFIEAVHVIAREA